MTPTPSRYRPRSPRRGVTLVEMLVTVALLVLMMSVIVQVFTAATGAVSAQRTYQELDNSLRQIDATIRSDLAGVTARLHGRPLNPKDGLGYFEYSENSFADSQGEDSDDTLRFTVKAPEGQLFTGRFFASIQVPNPSPAQLASFRASQPMTVTSQYAEVIYFLRNGNLYRRVLLVAPELQNAVSAPPFQPGAFGGKIGVSFQGVNDLSARPLTPNGSLTPGGVVTPALVLNTLGDLTNRENRWPNPRFTNDFARNTSYSGLDPDSLPDDSNGDSVPDFYPSLYWDMKGANRGSLTTSLINEYGNVNRGGLGASFDTMAFPYVYPGAYSRPHAATSTGGWIHSPDPANSQLTIALLNSLNHNPIDIGDTLPLPSASVTWWGFPTWRETLSPNWNDPYVRLAMTGQPNGLHPMDASVANPPNWNATNNLLPYMTTATFGNNTPYRLVAQPNTDNFGSAFFAALPTPPYSSPDLLWRQSWEDDLILTGVRSFDVKAYDNSFPGYVDLGWGDDGRLYVPYLTVNQIQNWVPPLLGNNTTPARVTWPPNQTVTDYSTYGDTLAHEGRIPPLVNDVRPDYQWPGWNDNLGDDRTSVVRLRRVWDSWSTDYAYAPSNGVNPVTGQPIGPPFGPPVYPSYPPPYPTPLRGLQIQIRVVDPRNERIKVLTIRQDFSDKQN